MALRHRAPALVVTTGSAVWVIQAAVGVHASVWGVGYLLLVHAAGELATGRQSWLPLIAASLSALLVSWKAPVFLVPIVLCWNWGRRSREHRARLSELKDRAARLEREREEIRSKVVVAAEQARIAHELHDVVAHNISVMVIQADAAACVLDSSPQQAKEMVDTIASTGRAAQIELNRPLGILRGS
ncbi:histidine kinase dimerization/phosphoacceptor domain-containing protein [Kitasatospora sp. NPDC002543]